MNTDKPLDPRQHTFSEAQGIEEAPQILGLGELPRNARMRLWSVFYKTTVEAMPDPPQRYSGPRFIWGEWAEVISDLIERFFYMSIDELHIFDPYRGQLGPSFDVVVQKCKPLFEGALYNEVFDMLVHLMRHPQCHPGFIVGVERVFEECRLAYIVDTDGVPTIFPAASPHEAEAIRAARRDLRRSGQSAADNHLQRAGDLASKGQWRESVRESVMAVESVARGLDTGGGTLGRILKRLKAQRKPPFAHPALLGCIEKIYGYRGNEQGVGHAATSVDEHVGRGEAVLVIGVCASFCTFLLEKKQNMFDASRYSFRKKT